MWQDDGVEGAPLAADGRGGATQQQKRATRSLPHRRAAVDREYPPRRMADAAEGRGSGPDHHPCLGFRRPGDLPQHPSAVRLGGGGVRDRDDPRRRARPACGGGDRGWCAGVDGDERGALPPGERLPGAGILARLCVGSARAAEPLWRGRARRPPEGARGLHRRAEKRGWRRGRYRNLSRAAGGALQTPVRRFDPAESSRCLADRFRRPDRPDA